MSVRLQDANNEPDARNDAGVTVVGKPVPLNVLANDTDPDNDPLSSPQRRRCVRPEGQSTGRRSTAVAQRPTASCSSSPASAGHVRLPLLGHRRRARATSPRSASRSARSTENRPPIAVRDDVVDPRRRHAPRLRAAERRRPRRRRDRARRLSRRRRPHGRGGRGVGYRVTVAADAPAARRVPLPDLRRHVRSGDRQPSSSPWPTAASVDQAPVAEPDIVEVRAGRTVDGARARSTTTTPRARRSTWPASPPRRRPTARIGPGGQDVYVSVGPDGHDRLLVRLRRRRRRRQPHRVVRRRCASCRQDEANRPPIARADVARTREGSPITIEVLANDTDPDGDPIRVEIIAAQPAFGVGHASSPTARHLHPEPTRSPGPTASRTRSSTPVATIAIGEVLVGVMPLSGANRAPRRSTTSSGRRRQRPARVRRARPTTPTPTATASS